MALHMDETSQPKKRSVSIRKVEANRRNALQSTGPRTPRGKAYARRNALKHGLYAGKLLTLCFIQSENPREFEKLLIGLTQYYEPVELPEELEVQAIAICWWKRSRAWRCENSEFHWAEVRNLIEGLENAPSAHNIMPE